jgi:endogenous inhibitor of DNA gyrase (YacG/DUF329 family)
LRTSSRRDRPKTAGLNFKLCGRATCAIMTSMGRGWMRAIASPTVLPTSGLIGKSRLNCARCPIAVRQHPFKPCCCTRTHSLPIQRHLELSRRVPMLTDDQRTARNSLDRPLAKAAALVSAQSRESKLPDGCTWGVQVQVCPGCKKVGGLVDGCNHIVCKSCHTNF